MPSTKTRSHIFAGRWGESGHPYMTQRQSVARFDLCREALAFQSNVFIRFKKLYESFAQMEEYSILDCSDSSVLNDKYLQLYELGYGGEFSRYDKFTCPEGALFPFVRLKGRKKFEFIDTGCIWIGTKFDYPRIFVDNSVANWLNPYSHTGFVRTDPFLPYFQVIKIKHKFTSESLYPDIELDSLV